MGDPLIRGIAAFLTASQCPLPSIGARRKGRVGWVGRRDGASWEPAILSALRQLRLIVVGATIGAIGGSVLLGTSVDLRPVAVAVAAGTILFGLTFAMKWLATQPVPHLAPAYSSLTGRVLVTLAAALSVVLVFNVLVAPEARSVPARRNAQATVAPMPAAPSQVAGPTNPVGTVVPVAPIVQTSPRQVVRPPDAARPTSSAPRATVVPVSSPAATSPVSPFATPPASPQSPPPSAATAAPVQSVAPATPQPATPQPTPVSSAPSIVPTLPPLPTLPIGLP
jgi:hypothetical protein